MSSKRTANQNVSFSVSLCVFRRVLPWLTALFDFFPIFYSPACTPWPFACAPRTISCVETLSPDGGSNLALQPGGNQIQPVHKWPLRPGVQVHVNGPNSLTLATSGSVLQSPSDRDSVMDQSMSGSGSRPGSADSHRPMNGRVKGRQLDPRPKCSDSQPHYESIRDEKAGELHAPATDSGSESTRSVIRVGPVRQSSHAARSAHSQLHQLTPGNALNAARARTRCPLRLLFFVHSLTLGVCFLS